MKDFATPHTKQQQQQQLGFSPLPAQITRPRPAATGQSLGLAGARLTPTHTRDTGRVVGSYFGPRPARAIADHAVCRGSPALWRPAATAL